MTKLIWLIRHGESSGNEAGRIAGAADVPLTNLGRRQAARVAERLAQESLTEIVSSHLTRASTTAEIIAAVTGLPLRRDARLAEYDFGPLRGLTREEIRLRYPHVGEGWDANEFWEPLPGEEGDTAFKARVEAAMDDIVEHMPEHSAVAIVTHGGVLNTCFRSFLGIEGRGWRTFAFDNASISVVELRPSPKGKGHRHNYRVLELNHVAHLGELRGKKPGWFNAISRPER